MHLVIFDIDGTLIHSYDEEVDFFEQALSNVMGIPNICRELETYEHVTDHGIANEIIYRAFQRSATPEEHAAIETEFLRLFEQALTVNPTVPIPGARQLFEELAQLPNVALAIATGCYKRSAELKFKYANLPFHHLPIGSSNDSPVRTNIMQTAHQRAKKIYDTEEFESITYIGDGPWDLRAVQALRWNFIAIASNYPEERLQEFGATAIVKDYACIESFIQHLPKSSLFNA